MLKEDHTGLPFSLNEIPERIICLVPSITELLHDIGLGEKVVGRTKFCCYPEAGFPNAEIIGGTKNIHTDKILALKPDLIIANKEENVREQVLALYDETNVFTTIVKNTKEALMMIKDIGSITGQVRETNAIINQFKSEHATYNQIKQLKMIYLIWRKPYMTVGGDTFISAFMEDFGFVNCLKEKERYPVIELHEIAELKPDIILLSSEPYPFTEVHKEEITSQTGITTNLIDGSICSWYGSRMLKAQDFFKTYMQQLRAESSLNNE